MSPSLSCPNCDLALFPLRWTVQAPLFESILNAVLIRSSIPSCLLLPLPFSLFLALSRSLPFRTLDHLLFNTDHRSVCVLLSKIRYAMALLLHRERRVLLFRLAAAFFRAWPMQFVSHAILRTCCCARKANVEQSPNAHNMFQCIAYLIRTGIRVSRFCFGISRFTCSNASCSLLSIASFAFRSILFSFSLSGWSLV